MSNHNNDRVKVYVIMVSSAERDSERDVTLQLEGVPHLDRMAQQVQNLSNFFL